MGTFPAIGQISQRAEPHRVNASISSPPLLYAQYVAVQVEFETHTSKAAFHLIGSKVETTWAPGAFQLRVRGSQRVPGPPPVRAVPRAADDELVRDGFLLLGCRHQTHGEGQPTDTNTALTKTK
jgi:hypothetical protein